MEISIIIPFHKDKDMIKFTVKRVVETIPSNSEIVIIGNNTNSSELEVSFPYDNCKYYKIYENLFYAKAINYGVSKSSGDIIVCLDPDIFVNDNWFIPLFNKIQDMNVGAASSKLLNPSTGRIIDFGMYYSEFNAIHSLLGAKHTHPLACFDRKVQSACSAILMTFRKLFDQVNGMNERLPFAYTDMDYCLKIKELGFDTWVVANSEAYHKGSSDTSNSKSYAFNYLNADSKAFFYADNYKKFKIDFDKWFLQSWNFFYDTHSNIDTCFMLFDFTTIYNKEDYYRLFDLMDLIILDKQNIIVNTRDCNSVILHHYISYEFINLSTPILFFVDLFYSLSNNDFWFRKRDISKDLVIDRHGNIVFLSEIANGIV